MRLSDARRENASSDAMANEQLERYLVRLQGRRGDATHEDLCLFTGRSSPSMDGEETTAQTRVHRPGIWFPAGSMRRTICQGTRRRRPAAMLMNSGHQGLLRKLGQTKIVRDPGGLCAIRRGICGIRCQGGLHHPGENLRRRSPCAKMSSARRVTPGTRGCGPSATNRGHWLVSAHAIQSTAQVTCRNQRPACLGPRALGRS